MLRVHRDTRDELDKYFGSDLEIVKGDVLAWWADRREQYPALSRMAIDYLSIPGELWTLASRLMRITNLHETLILATSVDVERVFSKGRIAVNHLRNRLSAQSTRAILCLNSWYHADIVKAVDLNKATADPGVEGDSEFYEEDWDVMGHSFSSSDHS